MKLVSVLVILCLGFSACSSFGPLEIPVGQIVDGRIEWSIKSKKEYWHTLIEDCYVNEDQDGCVVLNLRDFKNLLNKCKKGE